MSMKLRSGVFVEVGVAYGKSLTLMCELAYPNLEIYGVDLWEEFMGGDNLSPEAISWLRSHGTPLEACKASMGKLVGRVHCFYKFSSVEASRFFEDESVDLVFLDDRHEYDFLKAGIQAWLPKVKKGGNLAGHDYNEHFPGVMKAANELPTLEIRDNKDGWGGVWIHEKP